MLSIQHKFNNLIRLCDKTEQLLSLNYYHSHTSTLVSIRGEPTPKKEISSLHAHVNLFGSIWWNGFVFHPFYGWLNSEIYCEAVNQALSLNLREQNGYLYISDGISWHRSVQFEE